MEAIYLNLIKYIHYPHLDHYTSNYYTNIIYPQEYIDALIVT